MLVELGNKSSKSFDHVEGACAVFNSPGMMIGCVRSVLVENLHASEVAFDGAPRAGLEIANRYKTVYGLNRRRSSVLRRPPSSRDSCLAASRAATKSARGSGAMARGTPGAAFASAWRPRAPRHQPGTRIHDMTHDTREPVPSQMQTFHPSTCGRFDRDSG
jgi:hypothetical protein